MSNFFELPYGKNPSGTKATEQVCTLSAFIFICCKKEPYIFKLYFEAIYKNTDKVYDVSYRMYPVQESSFK